MKKHVRILEFLLGLVFVFSGFVKAVDPLGTKYKLIDYFNVLHLDFLAGLALPLAILLITTELMIGIMLVLNIYPKVALWLVTALMVVFTPLTLFLAIKNPILDCGCFGEALHLSNWQTFWKNVIFDLIIIVLWTNYSHLRSLLERKVQLILGIISIILILGFQGYNLSYLPVIDFRPYKVGTNLREAVKTVESTTQYKSVLIYRNTVTGEIKEFDEDNIPWEDTTWVWEETKTIVVHQGDENGIHDFFLYNKENQDIKDSLLAIKEPVLLIISYNLSKANKKGLEKTISFARKFTKKFYPKAYFITGSTDKEVENFEHRFGDKNIEILRADETMLKTVVRSNPGIVILRDGQIIGKYSFREKLNKFYKKIK